MLSRRLIRKGFECVCAANGEQAIELAHSKQPNLILMDVYLPIKSRVVLSKLIPELKFEFIEASCCGMAGSFGIETKNAEMSRQMAELSLSPELRAKPESKVIANGFSCQHQICSGTEHHQSILWYFYVMQCQ
ncbi:hypothetical protein [Candidatus Albibeggiatoa sp. nov. BB20]|uniref:hypothetical protein n=1 Tax=Candidatus Albibeggiatoa sp. nov. BB20 TaxID=3162723 RepID=UPI0033659D5C